MKRFLSVLLMLSILLSCFGTAVSSSAAVIGMPNPWTDCSSLKKAEKVAGFSFTIPKSIAGNKKRQYRAMSGNMIEVIYTGKKKQKIRLHKSNDRLTDISGDYNEYKKTAYIFVNRKLVKIKSNSDGIHVAIWYDFFGGYSYSLTAEKGLSQSSVEKVIKKAA